MGDEMVVVVGVDCVAFNGSDYGRQRQSDGRSASVSRCGIVYLACTREAWLAHWRLVRDCFLTGCAAPRPVPVQLQLYAGEGGRGRNTQLFFFYTVKQCHVMSRLTKQVKQ